MVRSHGRSLVLLLCGICLFVFSFYQCDAAKKGRKYMRDAPSDDDAPRGQSAASSSDAPLRKWGRLQRMRETLETEHEAEASAPKRVDRFTNNLKSRWVKGILSSKDVHDLARDAQSQGGRPSGENQWCGHWRREPAKPFPRFMQTFRTTRRKPMHGLDRNSYQTW